MADKFLPPLIDFIQEKFSHEGKVFYLYGDESVYGFLKMKYKRLNSFRLSLISQ